MRAEQPKLQSWQVGMDFKKKAKALLLRRMRGAGGQMTFSMNGRDADTAGRYLEELETEGKIEMVSRRASTGEIVYRIVPPPVQLSMWPTL